MRTFLFGFGVAALAAGTASAQLPAGTGSPPGQGGSFGGGFRPPNRLTFGPQAPAGGNFRMVQAPGGFRPRGFAAAYPYGYGGYGYGYGLGGGFVSGGYYGGYYDPYYVLPAPTRVSVPDAAPSGPAPFTSATAVSGLLPATLIVQFPAAAKVWVDGVEVPGDADTDWTLTSKALRPGESATFRVRGRWLSGGKTYEAVREVPLGTGARSRLIIVSGTEVTD